MVRGEIFRLRAARDARGSEQRGVRYAVILQSDELLPFSTVLIAPTSASASPSTFRPMVEVNGSATRVLADQLTTASLDRLGRSVGRLDAAELREVDEALKLVLGL